MNKIKEQNLVKDLYKRDTIAAIATPIGNGGIGIIRISGPESKNIALKIFKKKENIKEIWVKKADYFQNRKLHLGNIIEKENKIDEVLIVSMAGPYSYTGEDVIEIQAHAGIIGLREILKIIIDNGARLAEPGEFTKRSFLNGRIDLTQAEAVMDIISAKSEMALKIASHHLNGQMQEEILKIETKLKFLLSLVEANIDLIEENEETENQILKNEDTKKEIVRALEVLIKNHEAGIIIRDGMRFVILGRPNVGKSSLLNLLLKKDRAIVTPFPGTTRDIIEEKVNIRGLTINILDTAGVHETNDIVEIMGIEKTKKESETADVILFMVDAGIGIVAEDQNIYNIIKKNRLYLLLIKLIKKKEKR